MNSTLAFTLPELATRLNTTPDKIRRAMNRGLIACDQQPYAYRQLWDPVISRDAAVVFCISVGTDPRRVMS